MMIARKIWSMLTRHYRQMAVVQMFMMAVGMLLEMVGLGLVIPALMLMTGEKLPLPPELLAWLGFGKDTAGGQTAVFIGLSLLLVLYTMKTIFLAALAWQQSGFVAGLQADVSQRLFSTYLAQPWTFHLQRNSAQLIRNIFNEVGHFTQVCQFALTAITESFMIVGVAALLLVFEPLGTLIVGALLGSSTWCFQRLTRDRLMRWGRSRQENDGLRVQHVQQGLGAAKDVKLLGREEAFAQRYRVHNDLSARVIRRIQTVQQLPRLWYELIAVIGLVVLAGILVSQGRSGSALISTLGLFAAAAFRLLPSANRLLLASQGLQYALPVVEELHAELGLDVSPTSGSVTIKHRFSKEIALAGVTFRYPSVHTAAIRDVTLSIQAGSAVGIIGGSGSGKSTLVDVVLGLLRPAEGAVIIDGLSLGDDARWWQRQIGYVPQSIFLTDDTIRCNIALGLPENEIDDAAVERALKAAQLQEFVRSLPQGVETLVGERGVRLSGGQRQRIGIARALYLDPPVLVLDEATSSLDTATEAEVMQAVNQLHGQKTLIIVAHRLSTVAQCDQLIRLEHGRIIDQGTPAQVGAQ